MNDAVILTNTLYGALVRTPKIAGVSSDFFGVNFALSMIAFILSPPWILIGVPIHMLGYVVSSIDEHLFRIIFVNPNLPAMKNKKIWRVKTYEAS